MSKQDCHEIVAAGAQQAQDAALELFQIAALMIGDAEQAVSLVEETLAKVSVDPCADAGFAHAEACPQVVDAALQRMVRKHPGDFSAYQGEDSTSCIDTDELEAAGIRPEQLHALIQGTGRGKLREWLDQLSPALRAVFVLRAVVGQDGERAAMSLRRGGAGSWGKKEVAAAYRQALCSLASSLVNSNPVHAAV